MSVEDVAFGVAAEHAWDESTLLRVCLGFIADHVHHFHGGDPALFEEYLNAAVVSDGEELGSSTRQGPDGSGVGALEESPFEALDAYLVEVRAEMDRVRSKGRWQRVRIASVTEGDTVEVDDLQGIVTRVKVTGATTNVELDLDGGWTLMVYPSSYQVRRRREQ